MARTILVPLDGSPAAESVLPALTRILSPQGKVHLLHLLPSDTTPLALDYLARIRERFFPGLPGWDLVRTASPAYGILKVAAEKDIDLIAMTTHARSGLRRALLGSVAAEVVAKSRLPVLLTRPDTPACVRPIQRVLVPVDGDELPSELVSILRFLCPAAGQEVVLLRVGGPPPQDLADALEDEGFTAWPIATSGDPAEEIVARGKKFGVDLIAMPVHGRTGLERLVLGSVSEEVLRRSPVSVLLQKPLETPKPILAGGLHA